MIAKTFFKRNKLVVQVLLLAAVCLWLVQLKPEPALAMTPYTTWALGPGGSPFRTQDAYQPFAEIDLPINAAEDMFLAEDGALYIADTGNARIAKFMKTGGGFLEVASLGTGMLQGPTGVFVDADGFIYVADGKANTIVILDSEGNLVNQFGRPSEPLFGKSRDFLPRKIAVDARKNIYIISEGSVNGVVQMNTDGKFIGYFGANTASMSLKMILQRTFLTEEQLAQFVKNEAASPSNLAIDHQSMVYSITAGTDRTKSIRKFTISGKNIFPDAFGSASFKDIDTSPEGLVLGVDGNGQIYEFNSNGTLLFIFGAQDKGDQRLGTLRNPTAIERDAEFIYVLDKDKNAVIAYQTTAFARLVHAGVQLYMEGYYLEARPYFEEVLDYNGSFIMAYQAIADAYFKERDFDNALASYRYAEDRNGYSEAYWELRNSLLQQYLSPFILGLVGLWLGTAIVKRFERRYGWLDPARNWLKRLLKVKLVDDFVFMFRFIRQPADSFYYIKKNQRGSLLFALLLYLWVVVVRVVALYLTGFTFSPFADPAWIRVETEVTYVLLAILIWNSANYLVSTISDGEGRVRDVVIGTAYSLFPYAIFGLPIALISRVLTFNEVFIYQFSNNLMIAWVGLMLFIMVKEVHNYSFAETVRNVLLTIFTMILFVLTGYILYVLFSQLFDFVSAILQEVRLRG